MSSTAIERRRGGRCLRQFRIAAIADDPELAGP